MIDGPSGCCRESLSSEEPEAWASIAERVSSLASWVAAMPTWPAVSHRWSLCTEDGGTAGDTCEPGDRTQRHLQRPSCNPWHLRQRGECERCGHSHGSWRSQGPLCLYVHRRVSGCLCCCHQTIPSPLSLTCHLLWKSSHCSTCQQRPGRSESFWMLAGLSRAQSSDWIE